MLLGGQTPISSPKLLNLSPAPKGKYRIISTPLSCNNMELQKLIQESLECWGGFCLVIIFFFLLPHLHPPPITV